MMGVIIEQLYVFNIQDIIVFIGERIHSNVHMMVVIIERLQIVILLDMIVFIVERSYHGDNNYESTTKGTLTSHYRIHSGEKSFQSSHDGCNYRSPTST